MLGSQGSWSRCRLVVAEPAVHPAETQGQAIPREAPCHSAHAGPVPLRQAADGHRRAGQGQDCRRRAALPVGAGHRIAGGTAAADPELSAITIGESLRWDGARYWLVFSTDDTKMRTPIEEPLPDDLIPYLEAFLRNSRPVLLRQAKKFGGAPTHRRLWVDSFGNPMKEGTLRNLIKRYTRKEFGTAVWPHLFRDCLLTSVAVDQPDLMRIGATLLGHPAPAPGKSTTTRRACWTPAGGSGPPYPSSGKLLAVPKGELSGSDR